MLIIKDKEFEKRFGGNWMHTDNKGKYFRIAKEKIILTDCKDTKGNISTMPFIAIDNTTLECLMECFATMEEAKEFLSLNMEAKRIIDKRDIKLDFYVLVYNVITTEYLNEIVFQTYQEALKKFHRINIADANTVVEIIFSPQEDDKEYYDNVVIMRKEAK